MISRSGFSIEHPIRYASVFRQELPTGQTLVYQAGISDMDHVPFAVVSLIGPRRTYQPVLRIRHTSHGTFSRRACCRPRMFRTFAPATTHLRDTPAGVAPLLSLRVPSSRSRRMPRESLDALEDLPKEAPRQVARGQQQDEVPRMPDQAPAGLAVLPSVIHCSAVARWL
jgi:hypothetical protein